MSILFAQILNMSLTASVVILCVMAVRLLLKKAPKIFSYALWAVVLFRLLCPVSLTAPVSVLEVTSPQVTDTEGVSIVYYEPVESALEESGWQSTQVRQEPISIQELEQRQADTTPSVLEIASLLWLAGMAVMLLHSMVSYLRLYRNLIGAVPWRGNVYLADHIGSPFVLGVVFPKIYLPSDIPMAERRYILAHERHHIRRLDHIIKLLAYGALCIHWFNPLVWAAFLLAGKDMEMSCDEAVIKKLGEHVRADYSASLLRLATHRCVIAGTPLAFGEGDTKGRVKNMAKWKKPKVWISILCMVLCIIIVAVCALNPQEDTQEGKDSPIQIGQLPEGYAWKYDDDRNIVFTRGRDIVGGVVRYPIPEGVYDPKDTHFDWLFDVGIPDFEDESLIYMGGITSGDNGWAAEFASDVPEGQEPSVYRHHSCQVGEDEVYDIWFDMLCIDRSVIVAILQEVDIPREEAVYPPELSGPMHCAYGDLHYKRPTGIAQELRDVEDYRRKNGQENVNSVNPVWSVDGVEFGGIVDYILPEGTSTANMDWIHSLDLWEWEDENLGYFAGSSQYGICELEFFADVPPGTEVKPLQRKHYFFLSDYGNRVYDMWFDMTVADPDLVQEIVSSALVMTSGQYSAYLDHDEDQRIGAFQLTIPEDYGYLRNGDSELSLLSHSDWYGDTILGGVTVRPLPDLLLESGEDMLEWVKALGITWDESQVSHAITDETEYGDLSLSLDDLKDGKPVYDTMHYFYIHGGVVYDLWFDELYIDEKVERTILDSVRVEKSAVSDGAAYIMSPEAPEEEQKAGLEKCRAILDAVQNSSFHISQSRRNEGNAGPKGYDVEYSQHGEDWLTVTSVSTEGTNLTEAGEYFDRYANLHVNGVYFNNYGNWGNPELIWEKVDSNVAEGTSMRQPWLVKYQWDPETVTYMDTLTGGNISTVMLRINEPYINSDESGDQHYFVNFFFDSEGNFINVQVMVNLFRDDAFEVVESIVTLDPETVAAEINAEYQKAIG